MFSDVENQILEKLKKEFGSIHKSMDEEIVTEKVEIAKALYDQAIEDFRIINQQRITMF